MRIIRLALGSLLLLAAFVVHAQEPEQWTAPVLLSAGITDDTGAQATVGNPVLVADPHGVVHAFLAGKYNHQMPAADAVYYSRWNGEAWSVPVDILYVIGWISSFQVALDGQGWLHLVWISGGVWYSRVPAAQAGDAQAWSPPLKVSDGPASNVFVVAGSDGAPHVVYCFIGDEGYLAYLDSKDGRNWSYPLELWKGSGCNARMAIDGKGRMHLVFGDTPSAVAGNTVFYARSDDGGVTWLPPRTVDVRDARYSGNYGPAWPNVITVDDDVVHIIWDGAPIGQRWHQWSADGGETWTEPAQISAEQRGLTGPNALALDSEGTVHMVSMGWLETPDRPNGAFHTYWQDGRWAPLVHVGERTDWDAEGPVLAIAGGNELHAAWWSRAGEIIEVWTSSLHTDAPSTLPLARPTPTSEPTVQAAATATPTPEPTASPAASRATPAAVAPVQALPWQSDSSSLRPLLVGIIPVILLIGLVALVRSRRRLR